MNKFLLGIAISTLLLCACKPAAAPSATETPAPVAEAVAAAPAASGSENPAPAPTAAMTGTVPAPDDDTAINASIDSMLGDHTRYETVIKAYQAAVTAGDKAAVAALVSYPIDVAMDGKKTSIKDASGFVKNYDRIITPTIAGVISAQKYSALMVNSQGVMFGSGETWINGVCKKGSTDCSDFDVKVVTVQPGG